MTDTWAYTQRQCWIEEMLNIYGFINREHLRKKFWISTPQASADLQSYVRNNPKRVAYDATQKRYVRVKP